MFVSVVSLRDLKFCWYYWTKYLLTIHEIFGSVVTIQPPCPCPCDFSLSLLLPRTLTWSLLSRLRPRGRFRPVQVDNHRWRDVKGSSFSRSSLVGKCLWASVGGSLNVGVGPTNTDLVRVVGESLNRHPVVGLKCPTNVLSTSYH